MLSAVGVDGRFETSTLTCSSVCPYALWKDERRGFRFIDLCLGGTGLKQQRRRMMSMEVPDMDDRGGS